MWVGGVRVVLQDEEGRILMVRQHHEDRDLWMVPGGGIEEGEEVSPERGQRFVNYMIGRIIGGELALGSDPELSPDRQVLREVRFLSREEIDGLDNVYPKFFNEEIWGILEEGHTGMTYYKLRYSERG